METIQIDPQRQRRAKEYARLQRRVSVGSMLVGGLYVIAWLALGWAVTVRTALAARIDSPWLLVAAFAVVFGGISALLDLPMEYYTGFVLPHQYGQSNQTLSGWVGDQVKSLLISLPLGLGLLELIYTLLRAAPETWWLWVALVLIGFSVLMSNLAPVLIMPIFYRVVPLGEERADLVDRLTRLAERAGTRVRGVFQIDMSRRTKSANAAMMGLGNTRRIVLGDTLIGEFSDDEIETVMAHELGHHVHRDLPLGILVEGVLTLVGLALAALVLRLGVSEFHLQSPADPASLPLLALAMGAYGLVTMPLGNAFSRWRERRADQYALRMTGNGAAYASALARLANQNLSDADPEPWVEWLFYSHPALGKRIRMAQEWGNQPSSG
ncbi:MAG TPA: M48 family metallopeptidase [Anaerolineaceae bacterium]|nr:M48 family metallopeptidase [Anaerolineaceae bacterium]